MNRNYRPQSIGHLLLLIIISATLVSCNRRKLDIQPVRGIDFTRYETFALLPPPTRQFDYLTDPLATSADIRRQVADAIVDVLSAKGYKKTTAIPDLLVAYYLSVNSRMSPKILGYDYRSDGYETSSSGIEEKGTVVIDLIDNKKNRLLWRGSGSGIIRQSDEINNVIRRGVRKILETIPLAG